jgi:hypothetical protein
VSAHGEQVSRLRALCPETELWDEAGAPLVFLPNLKVEAAGTVHIVDALLCPRRRDNYESRLYFSVQLPVNRNWASHGIMTRTWWAFSWQGISANQPWIDILAGHLEALK